MFFDGVTISFKASWEIELYDDFVQFQAYVPNEGWINLHGKHTAHGSGQQGQPWKLPGYHGLSDGWVEETIPLKQLNGLIPTKFRFIFISDNYGNGDGFFVDDFGISGYPNIIPGDINMDSFLDVFETTVSFSDSKTGGFFLGLMSDKNILSLFKQKSKYIAIIMDENYYGGGIWRYTCPICKCATETNYGND